MTSTVFLEKLKKDRELLMKEIDRVLSTVRDIERTLIGLVFGDIIVMISKVFAVSITLLTPLSIWCCTSFCVKKIPVASKTTSTPKDPKSSSFG